MYSHVEFFKGKDKSFIAWVATIIRPQVTDQEDYIYKEGEDIVEIYFLVKGAAGFVLPRYNNRIYKQVLPGQHFGHSELVTDKDFIDAHKAKKLE